MPDGGRGRGEPAPPPVQPHQLVTGALHDGDLRCDPELRPGRGRDHSRGGCRRPRPQAARRGRARRRPCVRRHQGNGPRQRGGAQRVHRPQPPYAGAGDREGDRRRGSRSADHQLRGSTRLRDVAGRPDRSEGPDHGLSEVHAGHRVLRDRLRQVEPGTPAARCRNDRYRQGRPPVPEGETRTFAAQFGDQSGHRLLPYTVPASAAARLMGTRGDHGGGTPDHPSPPGGNHFDRRGRDELAHHPGGVPATRPRSVRRTGRARGTLRVLRDERIGPGNMAHPIPRLPGRRSRAGPRGDRVHTPRRQERTPAPLGVPRQDHGEAVAAVDRYLAGDRDLGAALAPGGPRTEGVRKLATTWVGGRSVDWRGADGGARTPRRVLSPRTPSSACAAGSPRRRARRP